MQPHCALWECGTHLLASRQGLEGERKSQAKLRGGRRTGEARRKGLERGGSWQQGRGAGN